MKTTQELKDDGYSDNQLRRAVAQRLAKHQNLVRLRQGWYATSRPDADVVAAVCAGGSLTCVSAVKFYQRNHCAGIWVPPDAGLHVRLAKAAEPRRPGVCYCHGPGRRSAVVHAVDSLPMALHSASLCLPQDFWIAMCESVLHHTDWTVPDLQLHMGKVSPGLLRMMRRCTPLSESGTESIARVRLEAAGYKVHIQPRIGANQRADLRIGRLLIECDSEANHSGAARRRDLRRDRRTLGHGWVTMRIDYADILYHWDEVLADIAEFTATGRHRIRGTAGRPTPID